MIERAGRLRLLSSLLREPSDAAGLAVFRILFGVVMLASVVRFAALGWIRELYLEPSYHFTFLGFGWVRPWPAWGLYLHFALMGASALLLTIGYRTRLSAGLFFVLFSYVELLDKSAYLNHYYLVSLLALLCVFVPSGAAWSLDARRSGGELRVPRGSYWLLRGQMTIVYFYAGVAKLNPDWLWRAEPLRAWLATYSDTPLLGAWVEQPWLAPLMSWGGLVYDLSIAPLLLWRRTRPLGVVFALGFHLTVGWMFPIGVFPWVMLVAMTVFFQPDWPRHFVGPGSVVSRLFRRLAWPVPSATAPRSAWCGPVSGRALTLAAAYLVVQALLPLRFVLYPGWVNWNEEGFRFAWRVMLMEKVGHVEYDVDCPPSGERVHVYPRRELSKLQYRMMSTQPDMIHQYALYLADRYRGTCSSKVRVFADAWASLNGRPSHRLIDNTVDLAREPRSLGPTRFIVSLE